MRINKYLAKAGICSRRKADELISEGKVKVNNKMIKEYGIDIIEEDVVKVNNKVVKMKDKKIYIVFNKPRGYITTVKDEKNRKSVLDLINIKDRIYPVGRLDRNTEGLLILTNDGDFTNNLIHPSKKVEKEYIVKVDGEITENKINLLRSGLKIDGYKTKPAKVEQIKISTLSIIIYEGRNRQVRKMCEEVGLEVKYLKRVRIGNLILDNIPKGKYKVLNKEEIDKKIYG